MTETFFTSQEGTTVIPIDLIEKVEKGECVLFVGPEASLSKAGYLSPPGPATLAGEIAQRIGYLPADISLPWVAQLYEERFSKRDLRDFIARRLDDLRYCPTLIHHWIASLPFETVISTAYDRLLDQLLLERNRALKYVLEDDDLSSRRSPQLIKLYGTVAQPGSLRVTEEDLETLFEHLPGIGDLLRWLSRTHTLLFIGYYLGDATFRRMFSALRRELRDRAPAAFVIHPAPDPAEVAFWQRRDLITIPAEPEAFLAELQDQIARQRGISPPPVPQPIQPPDLDEQSRRQLDEVVTGILGQMGLSGTAEGSMQLRSAARNLSFVRQLLSEHARLSGLGVTTDDTFPPSDTAVATGRAQILLQYGNAEWAERNYDQARQYFEEALKYAPDLVETYFSLHYLLAEIGKLDMALDIYQQALVIAPERALLPPRYEIQVVLGMGNLGIVYRVYDTQENVLLSVTVLRSVFSRDLETLEQFEETMARLQHPQIPRLVRRGHHRGRSFIAWEYAQGTPLTYRLQGQPLPMSEAFSILDQVGEALEYAHGHSLPHLGLSPSVILLSGEGKVKLIHFGETDLVANPLYISGGVVGAADYLSPEQRAGSPADGRSDIYALGTVAYEMFTGHPPGVGAYEPPSHVNPDADEALDVLVARSRAIDPDQRFLTIEQMHREIQRIAQISRPGGEYIITQLARRILRLASHGLKWLLMTPGGWAALVLVLVSAGLAEVWATFPLLHVIARLLLLLGVNVIPASFLCYWRVRETARVTGFGSLIHSGRGIGGVFGALMTLWHLRNVTSGYQPIPLAEICSVGFWQFVGATSMFTLALTFVMLVSVQVIGRMAHRRWKRYTGGFYVMFLLWCVLIILFSGWIVLGGQLDVGDACN